MHLIILKWLRRQKSRQKRKTMRQRDVEARAEIVYESVFVYLKRDRSWHENVHFFFLISLKTCSKSLNNANSLLNFVWFLMHYLQHFFSSDRFAALVSLEPYIFCFWIYEFFKNHPWGWALRNVNSSNLEDVLQRNLRADRTTECIFKAFGGTISKMYPLGANHVGAFVNSL